MLTQAPKQGGTSAERGNTMKTKTRMIVSAAVATIALAGMGQNAIAGGGDINSKVNAKFNFKGFDFVGHVKSQNACEKHRQVQVFEKMPGKDDLVSSDKTDSGGKFRASAGGSVNGGSQHYAVALEKDLGNGKTCVKAKSDTFIPDDNL